MRRGLGLGVVAIVLAGCASTSTQAGRQPSPLATASSGAQPSATAGGAGPGSPSATGQPAGAPAAGVCRDPHEHVYNPDRLRLIDPCMTITGTVDLVRSEPDGDYHILFRLDPAYSNLVNNANIASERGDLVLEPVCEIRVTQRDAIQACSGVSPSVPVPVVGTHYTATGAYVLDQSHGWMELHPLWDLHPS